MVNIKNVFSTYMSAKSLKLDKENIRGKPLTISEVKSEIIQDEAKIVVSFDLLDSGLVLNRTKAYKIAEKCGDETDKWPGHKITLGLGKETFNGKEVDAIVIERVD